MMNENDIQEINKHLQILKKNRENVPLSELNGKYAAAYINLLRTIHAEGSMIMKRYLTDCYPFRITDGMEKEEFVDRIGEIVSSKEGKKILQEATERLLKDYNVNSMLVALDPIREECEAAYMDYWEKHSILDGGKKRGRIYNDIVGLYWNGDDKLWETEDGLTFAILYPPMKEKKK